MKSPRKYPVFSNQTVEQWLQGHQERVYASVGPFTFSLAVEAGRVVRISRYDNPARIPDDKFVTELLPSIKLAEYLIRWADVYPADREIDWDESTTRKTEVAA